MATAEEVSTDLQSRLHEMASGFEGGLSKKEIINRLARLVHMEEGQVKRIYYGEWRVIPAHVFIQINEAYRAFVESRQAYLRHQLSLLETLDRKWDETGWKL